MATINSGIRLESNFLNLKEMDIKNVKEGVKDLLIEKEEIINVFQTIRDQVVFTDKRIIVINVQGITGKKVAYYSYPYSKVQYFGIETAGLLDIDSELLFTFSNGTRLQFDFRAKVDIKRICNAVSKYIL